MICIDGTSLDSAASKRGIGSYVKHLIDYFATDLDAETMILRNDKRAKDKNSIILPLLKVPERAHWLTNAILLPKLLSKNKVHFFHSTHPYTVTRSKKYITVATVYDIIPLIFYEEYLQKKGINANKSYSYYLNSLQFADHIIAISEQTKNDLISYLNIPAEKITVIHLAVDTSVFSYHADRKVFDNLYTKHNLPQKYFLYVGGADFRKNVTGLIKAYSLVADKVQEDLVLVGSWYDIWLQNFNVELEKLNIKHRVKFLSYISNDDICGVYSLATALLFPSLYEGFGFPVLEAFISGTPVLCSNNSSLIEIAEGCAYTVNPASVEEIANGIVLLASDASYRKQLTEKGLKKAQEFSIEKMCRETLNVYKKFV